MSANEGHQFPPEGAGTLSEQQAGYAAIAPNIRSSETSTKPGDPPRKQRIFLVEDNADMRDLLHPILSQHWTVEAFGDGLSALEMARQSRPDLILSDVRMPRLSGVQLLREIRADPKTSAIPVVLISAWTSEQARLEALEAKADDYVEKPFSTQELLVRISTRLEMARLREELVFHERVNRAKAESAHREVRAILDSISDGFACFGRDWHCNYVNHRALEFMRLGKEDLLGRQVWEVFPALVGTQVYTDLTRALSTGVPLQFDEFCPLHNAWYEIHAYPWKDGIAVCAYDITKQKRSEEEHERLLEARVAQRTADWQEIAQQMEAFCYTIAHDLRAPLRAMQGFAQALLEDHGSQLDVTAKDYASRVVAAAQRLDNLIQDLLAYSRLSRTELGFGDVNLGLIVEGLLESLAEEIRQKNAIITVERPLPRILGHAFTVQQLIWNLLSNALKFVPQGSSPRIRIWAEELEHSVRLWVEDNGIGIAPEHQERIFRVFERLHATDAYAGTGIGLAMVRKGAERMGGQVGVESELGQGSKFWIKFKKSTRAL